jgi:putative transposase
LTLMRNPLKRYYGRGDLHFVTFSCYRRRPLLATARSRDRFVKILDLVRSKRKFLLLGFVVMPEHVHLLLSVARFSIRRIGPGAVGGITPEGRRA